MKFIFKYGHIIVLFLVFVLAFIGFYQSGFIGNKKYISSEFNINILKSDIDYDNDGIDDYTDILNGAKEFVSKKPKYKSSYYDGGYPTDNYFVCTDVIWYALNNAGYNLKDLMDNDIKKNKDDYNIDTPDPNIDFRRVRNINVFLKKYTEVLTNDYNDIEAFQPGDIVVFKNSHIAIISDYRNKDGVSFIIHHDGYHKYEENGLKRNEIIGHYRFKLNME